MIRLKNVLNIILSTYNVYEQLGTRAVVLQSYQLG